MFTGDLKTKAKKLIDACVVQKIRVTTAESCTGGLIAALLTEISGASGVVDCGFVTYCNDAKHEFLNVPKTLLETHGAVSENVARAMAEGALAQKHHANLAVSVTGIAGPGGGSEQKPVGTVHLAIALKGKETLHRHKVFRGNRSAIRVKAVREALRMMLSAVSEVSKLRAEEV